MNAKEIVKQLRAEAAQLNKAADMIEGSAKKGRQGRPPKNTNGEGGPKRRGRPPKKKSDDQKS